MSWLAIVALAAGTYLFRIIGPLFRHRVRIPVRVEQLLSDASVVVLVALVANQTLISGAGFAGWPRVVGVAVGAVLALVNLPAVRQLVGGRLARSTRGRTGPDTAAGSARQRPARRLVHIPFPVIIIAAAVTAAALRLAG